MNLLVDRHLYPIYSITLTGYNKVCGLKVHDWNTITIWNPQKKGPKRATLPPLDRYQHCSSYGKLYMALSNHIFINITWLNPCPCSRKYLTRIVLCWTSPLFFFMFQMGHIWGTIHEKHIFSCTEIPSKSRLTFPGVIFWKSTDLAKAINWWVLCARRWKR